MHQHQLFFTRNWLANHKKEASTGTAQQIHISLSRFVAAVCCFFRKISLIWFAFAYCLCWCSALMRFCSMAFRDLRISVYFSFFRLNFFVFFLPRYESMFILRAEWFNGVRSKNRLSSINMLIFSKMKTTWDFLNEWANQIQNEWITWVTLKKRIFYTSSVVRGIW